MTFAFANFAGFRAVTPRAGAKTPRPIRLFDLAIRQRDTRRGGNLPRDIVFPPVRTANQGLRASWHVNPVNGRLELRWIYDDAADGDPYPRSWSFFERLGALLALRSERRTV